MTINEKTDEQLQLEYLELHQSIFENKHYDTQDIMTLGTIGQELFSRGYGITLKPTFYKEEENKEEPEPDGERKVKCNHCEWQGLENDLFLKGEGEDTIEYCPKCDKSDALMDNDIIEI